MKASNPWLRQKYALAMMPSSELLHLVLVVIVEQGTMLLNITRQGSSVNMPNDTFLIVVLIGLVLCASTLSVNAPNFSNSTCHKLTIILQALKNNKVP
jgi:hypothetical protein